MDVAMTIEVLVPAAEYYGSTTANTKECFDALDWNDERKKPTWAQMEKNAVPIEIDPGAN
ncbi:hypothetical protein UFOVP482_15 [uncultured Caudovirales phage]|uniref:Uncharacterized protein n=1 Tax=uncultured Caudovirales phage TaxID=2100421 RepID=A0A6J5MHF7_9CAUD|nr:hypothetical protein UFOVP482_15 [uncultured Caudovirales phage]